MPWVIQRMINGRKYRFALELGKYWGQTAPTPKINTIMSRRTRVSQSNHSRLVALCCLVIPMSDALKSQTPPHASLLCKMADEGEFLPRHPPIEQPLG